MLRMRTRRASAYWWKRMDLAAVCRCWATESAMSFMAAVFSAALLAVWVERVGSASFSAAAVGVDI